MNDYPSNTASSASATPSSPVATTSRITLDHADDTRRSISPATTSTTSLSASSFAQLGVEPFLCKALQAMSIRRPTEVQAACIPPILAGSDCIGSAQTGSGKTIAFALPIMQALAKDPYGLFALVLTPTRELAFQISEQFRVIGAAVNLHSAVIVGGMDMMTQAIELRKRPHVLIATPGRLVDLIKSNQGEWSLGRAKFLVLDEADRLLTPTFAPELAFLIDQLPAQRQTLLFTATLTDPVLALQKREPTLGKPRPFMHVTENAITTPAGLTQKYIFIPSQVREVYLVYLLLNLCAITDTSPLRPVPTASDNSAANDRRHRSTKKKSHRANSPAEADATPVLPQTILFVPHCRTAALLTSLLAQLPTPIPCTALHSHLSQPERLQSLSTFRRQLVPLLIATDVGSRGLDIPEVAVVLNWEVPRVPDDYVHRVGRTARAGRRGVSITVVTEGDVELVQALEKRIGTQLEELDLPEGPVLELLSSVSMAKRMANMQLHSEGFGKRQETIRKKHGAVELEGANKSHRASEAAQAAGKGGALKRRKSKEARVRSSLKTGGT